DLQAAHDDPQGRVADRPALVGARRPARDALRHLPPRDTPGRIATTVERAARRHEPDRPAAGATRVHARAGEGTAGLPQTAVGSPRRDGPGPGPATRRLGRQQRPPQAGLRPLLHPAAEPLARPATDALHVLLRSGRALRPVRPLV